MPIFTSNETRPTEELIAQEAAPVADDRDRIGFVHGAWLALTCLALWFVAQYGIPGIRFDDWDIVRFITGVEAPNLNWLIKPEMGHRIPVGKAVLLADFQLFGYQLKPVMYLNVILFSALALGLAQAARRTRGYTSYYDAFFPIVLLNLGHAENFCRAQGILYILPTTLAGILLILIVTHRGLLSRTGILVAGFSLVLLPLVSGGGVVFAGPMAFWLAFQGVEFLRAADPARKRWGVAALLLAATVLGLVALSFTGHEGYRAAPAAYPVEPNVKSYLVTAAKFLAVGFGMAAARPLWPVSGLLIGALLAAGSLVLSWELIRNRIVRDPRVFGLACYLTSCFVVAVAFGIGKCTWGDYVFDSRYVATSVPVLLGLYFLWELCGPRAILRSGRLVLFTVVAAFLAANTQMALYLERWVNQDSLAFQHEMRSGASIPYLVCGTLNDESYLAHDRLANQLKKLRDARVAPYDRLPPDPSFRKETLPLDAVETGDLEWDGHAGRVLGVVTNLRFDLKKPQYVCGLRIRCSCVQVKGITPFLRVGWLKANPLSMHEYVYYDLPPDGTEKIIECFIYEDIKSVFVHPNNRPSSFTISEIELLLPTSEAEIHPKRTLEERTRIPSLKDRIQEGIPDFQAYSRKKAYGLGRIDIVPISGP